MREDDEGACSVTGTGKRRVQRASDHVNPDWVFVEESVRGKTGTGIISRLKQSLLNLPREVGSSRHFQPSGIVAAITIRHGGCFYGNGKLLENQKRTESHLKADRLK